MPACAIFLCSEKEGCTACHSAVHPTCRYRLVYEGASKTTVWYVSPFIASEKNCFPAIPHRLFCTKIVANVILCMCQRSSYKEIAGEGDYRSRLKTDILRLTKAILSTSFWPPCGTALFAASIQYSQYLSEHLRYLLESLNADRLRKNKTLYGK